MDENDDAFSRGTVATDAGSSSGELDNPSCTGSEGEQDRARALAGGVKEVVWLGNNFGVARECKANSVGVETE